MTWLNKHLYVYLYIYNIHIPGGSYVAFLVPTCFLIGDHNILPRTSGKHECAYVKLP